MINNFGNINTDYQGYDYLKRRDIIISSFRWSNSNTDQTIDNVIENFAFDPTVDMTTNDTNKVVHLMTKKGMTQQESEDYLIKKFADFRVKERESYTNRRNSKQLTIVVSSLLSFTDARDFIETTKTLMDLYSEDGIVGVNYGVVGEGIIDYIESTVGTSYENTGLAVKGYTIKGAPVNTLQDLIDGLKDVLINGNY